ncbi:ABC transporter substrate-binding protein [Isoptericola sp. NPDC055881]
MERLSRRAFLAGSLSLTGLAAAGALSGCSPTVSISSDPKTLTLWYWNLSIAESLLATVRKGIPGTRFRLDTDKVSTGIDVKLRTSLAGGAYVPDVTALNSNVATYFPIEDQFHDLNELGAGEYSDKYLEWKLQMGVTSNDRLCFWPMDTGPTALWYRRDVFADAGLPSEPDEVTASMTGWDAWIEAGKKLRTDADAAIITSSPQAFAQLMGASADRYFDSGGARLYDRENSAVRQAWDVAVQAGQEGVTARAFTDTEKNSALSAGRLASNIEAAWWGPQLQGAAPDTKGLWGVAHQPGLAGNNGGSFLAVPKTAKDPEAAFALLAWLTSPEHQVTSYEEAQLFPSTPDSFVAIDPDRPDEFCGGQPITQAFVRAAEEVPTTFISPYENLIIDGINLELTNVETQNKDPERAWDDAMARADRLLQKKGLI